MTLGHECLLSEIKPWGLGAVKSRHKGPLREGGWPRALSGLSQHLLEPPKPMSLCINIKTGFFFFLIFRLPRLLSGERIHLQCRRHGRYRFDPWVRKIPWSRKRQPTPVFLPGESHGHRSLADPWGHRVGHDWALSTHGEKGYHWLSR